jgi:hypothetical protein
VSLSPHRELAVLSRDWIGSWDSRPHQRARRNCCAPLLFNVRAGWRGERAGKTGDIGVRIVYTVVETSGGWIVRRGHTSSLRFDTQQRALHAAENLAKAAIAHGDRAAVKLIQGGEVRATKIFTPQWVPLRA